MTPSDDQIRDWGDRLFALKEEMEEGAWNSTPDVHQPPYLSLVHVAWQLLRQEHVARERHSLVEVPALEEEN